MKAYFFELKGFNIYDINNKNYVFCNSPNKLRTLFLPQLDKDKVLLQGIELFELRLTLSLAEQKYLALNKDRNLLEFLKLKKLCLVDKMEGSMYKSSKNHRQKYTLETVEDLGTFC